MWAAAVRASLYIGSSIICSRLVNFLLASNPWYIIAAVAFSASNRPDAVPHVFQCVMKDIQKEENLGITSLEEKRQVARKLRDALFKSGLTSGYPRVRAACTLPAHCVAERSKLGYQ